MVLESQMNKIVFRLHGQHSSVVIQGRESCLEVVMILVCSYFPWILRIRMDHKVLVVTRMCVCILHLKQSFNKVWIIKMSECLMKNSSQCRWVKQGPDEYCVACLPWDPSTKSHVTCCLQALGPWLPWQPLRTATRPTCRWVTVSTDPDLCVWPAVGTLLSPLSLTLTSLHECGRLTINI